MRRVVLKRQWVLLQQQLLLLQAVMVMVMTEVERCELAAQDLGASPCGRPDSEALVPLKRWLPLCKRSEKKRERNVLHDPNGQRFFVDFFLMLLNCRCVVGGTGTLGMPHAVSESGWLGSLIIVLALFMSTYTGCILIDCLYLKT